ncbi:MAG: serine acetyltransferase [Verrucomicrobia bacterium]|nr:serine acetyltransferase [Verrucomicrobiota bacterium]
MDPKFVHLAERLLASYRETGAANLAENANLPSKRAVHAICEGLLQLLFPGYLDTAPIAEAQLGLVTSERLARLALQLQAETCKALRTRSGAECPNQLSQAHTQHFLAELPAVRALLATDIQSAFEGDPAASGTDEVILAYPYVEAIGIQRCAHVLYRLGVPILPRVMTEWAHARTGMDIHPGAEIGGNFFIDHGTGVVIGETSVIGSHVKLYQGVSLTARSLAGGQALRGQKRHPTVEDGVTIYAGTTIMGGDTVIGAGSTIGANVFLTQSVPANSLVYYEETQLRILPKKSRPAAISPAAVPVAGG